MKMDWYLKTVLTIISVCLTFICLKDLNLIKSAQAQEPQKLPQEVIIVGWKNKIEAVPYKTFRESAGLPVSIIEKK